jgi:hypothetical protein
MSVRVMTLVWERSRHSGTELLMLLALADWSDDTGSSYPSMSRVAAKCRMTPRNAINLVKALQAGGELEVKVGGGPKGLGGNTNLYRISVRMLEGMQPASRVKPTTPVKPASEVNPSAQGSEAGFLEVVKPTSPNTSLIRQDPSGSSSKPTKRLPPCPFDQIRELYNASLPNDSALPPRRATVCDSDRKNLMLATWKFVLTEPKDDGSLRAESAAEALEWFRKFFAKAWESDHLAGRATRGPGHEKWRCDLDHLLTEKCRKRVIEE